MDHCSANVDSDFDSKVLDIILDNNNDDFDFNIEIPAQHHRKNPWDVRFKELAIYKEINGNCDVPQSQGALGNWVKNQRHSYMKNKLSQERILQCNNVGFNWVTQLRKKSSTENFKESLNQLIDYKEKNGNCNVPQSQGPLGTWVSNKRQRYKKGKLSQEHINQLESIGFKWGKQRKKFDAMQSEERFKETVVYKEKNGNCNVSRSHGSSGTWESTQQISHNRRGSLSHERTTQHTVVAFNRGTQKQSSDNEQWNERFNKLVAYKRENGACYVPQKHGALGIWVKTQRRIHKKGKLSQERTTQLEVIGFNWGVQKHKFDADMWRERFNKLVAYKEINDNCNVPQRHGALGIWVSTQRKFYHKGKLSQERIAQLEDIGFVWKLKRCQRCEDPVTP